MAAGKRKVRVQRGWTLEQYLDDLVDHQVVGSRHALAEAIGSTSPNLTLAASPDYARQLTIEQCYRLAFLGNAEPADILRLAGRGELADLVDQCQSRPDFALTRREKEYWQLWRQLTGLEKHHLTELVRFICAEKARAGTAGADSKSTADQKRSSRRVARP